MDSGTEEQLLQLSLSGKLPPSLQKSFDEAKEKGNNAYRQARYHEAIQHYTTAESINPLSAIPPANRAMVYLKLNDYERAKAEAAIAYELLESVPEESQNKRLRAKILLRRATANKELLLFALAAEDYQAVLDIEDNAIAKAELDLLRAKYGVRAPTHRVRSRNSHASDTKIKIVSEGDGHTNGVATRTRTPAVPLTDIQNETEILQLSDDTMHHLVLKWSTSEPRNATEFERSWKSLKGDDLAQSKYLLDVVGPERIERGLLGEMLTPQLLEQVVTVLSAAVTQYRPYSTSAARILTAFSRVSRFDMILMFLSSAERQEITGLIDLLEENGVTPALIRSLKHSYL